MIWNLLAAISNGIIACLVTYKLYCCFHRFNMVERIGLGLLGGSALVTIPPLVLPYAPSAEWGVFTFRFGIAVYLVGRLLARGVLPPLLRWRIPHHRRAGDDRPR